MKVRAVWEFDADVSDIDPKQIDIPGLAKDLAENELRHMIKNNLVTIEEFEFSVVIE